MLPDFSDASLVADGGKNTYNTTDRDTEAANQAAPQQHQKQGKPVYGFNLPSVSTKLTNNRAFQYLLSDIPTLWFMLDLHHLAIPNRFVNRLDISLYYNNRRSDGKSNFRNG